MPEVKSEMAGTLLEFKVKQGDSVSVGQEVAIFESMKMEVPLESKIEGKVKALLKAENDFVNEGDPILELE